ncbi:MAG: 2-oxo acid dehydrogenase subunit E2, partial [Micrococcaceae bacterium]
TPATQTSSTSETQDVDSTPLATTGDTLDTSATDSTNNSSVNTNDTTGSDSTVTEVTLPELGESVTEGTVTRWLVSEGDTVEVDQPIVEISTDKVDSEVPSPIAGTVTQLLAQEDDTVEVGNPLAIIGGSATTTPTDTATTSSTDTATSSVPSADDATTNSVSPAVAATAGATAATIAASAQTSTSATNASATAGGPGIYASPLVRKDAREKGIDLSTIQGTGVGGRITREDLGVTSAADATTSTSSSSTPSAAPVAGAAAAGAMAGAAATQSTASASTATPATATTGGTDTQATTAQDTGADFEVSPLRGTMEKASRMRQVIAQRMKDSLDQSAQLTQIHEVDMSNIVKLRNAKKDEFLQREGTKLTFLPFFAKAVAEALQQFPKLNATFDQDAKTITYPAEENIAFAVDTPKGLLVPVVPNAGNLSVAEFAQKINDVAARTRDGKIGPNELSGGTFTITNYGSVGAISDTPIINQPQAAILGLGAIVKRPWVVTTAEGDDTIAIRSIVTLSLTYDHCLVDGADAGRFMSAVKKRLEAADFDV